MIEWLEVYNQERKEEEEKRRKTQELHHQENLSVLSNLVDVLKAWKKWIQVLPDFPWTDLTESKSLSTLEDLSSFSFFLIFWIIFKVLLHYLLGLKPWKWIIFEVPLHLFIGLKAMKMNYNWSTYAIIYWASWSLENELYLKYFCIYLLCFLKPWKWIIFEVLLYLFIVLLEALKMNYIWRTFAFIYWA